MKTESTIVDDVRRRALQISERYGHDLKAYATHLKEIEGQHPDRTVGQICVVRNAATTREGSHDS